MLRKLWRRLSEKTTYGQLMRIFILMITASSMMFFLVISYSYHCLRDETIDRMTRRLQTGISRLEDDLGQVQRRGLELLIKSDTQKITYLFDSLSAFDQAHILKNIQETLSSIQSGSSVVSGQSLWLNKKRWLIHALNTSVSFQENVDLSKEAQLMHNRTLLLLWEEIPRLLISDSPRSAQALVVSELNIEGIVKQLSDPADSSSLFYIDAGNDRHVFTNCTDSLLCEHIHTLLSSKENPCGYSVRDGYMTVYALSNMLNMRAAILLPINDVFHSLHILAISAAALLLFMGICFLLLTVSVQRIIDHPINELLCAFDSLNEENLGFQISAAGNRDFSRLYQGFNSMSTRLNELVAQSYKDKILLQQSELKQLQYQMNPHFLYNSFLMISQMIQTEDRALVADVAKKMGRYFRYITKGAQDFIPLADEWQHGLDYAQIQALRFGNRIRIEMNSLPAYCRSLQVPKLILQPLLENAFKYALECTLDHGVLRVGVQQKQGILFLSVEDNGELLDDEQLALLEHRLRISDQSPSSESALINIQKRIAFYTHGAGSLSLSRSALGGLCVTLVLPLPKEEIS